LYIVKVGIHELITRYGGEKNHLVI